MVQVVVVLSAVTVALVSHSQCNRCPADSSRIPNRHHRRRIRNHYCGSTSHHRAEAQRVQTKAVVPVEGMAVPSEARKVQTMAMRKEPMKGLLMEDQEAEMVAWMAVLMEVAGLAGLTEEASVGPKVAVRAAAAKAEEASGAARTAVA